MGMVRDYATILSNRVSAKAALAEFYAVSILVIVGTGVEIGLGRDHDYGWFAVAAAFGLTLGVMMYATEHTSGGQLNPAISLALVSGGYQPLWQAILNIIAQMLGAVVGSWFLMMLLPPNTGSDLGLNTFAHDATRRLIMQAFFAELIGTFIITFVYLETKMNPKSKHWYAAPAAVGVAYLLAILAFGPLTTGSFNPARSFGPALVTFHFRFFWLFFFAPILGALLAVPAHLVFVAEWDTFADSADAVINRMEEASGGHGHVHGQSGQHPSTFPLVSAPGGNVA